MGAAFLMPCGATSQRDSPLPMSSRVPVFFFLFSWMFIEDLPNTCHMVLSFFRIVSMVSGQVRIASAEFQAARAG